MSNKRKNPFNLNDNLLHSLKGIGMGVAEVIPGVSGGTIAFITGIYERLIEMIKSFDLKFFKTFFTKGPVKAIKNLDLSFIISLMIGMLIGVGIGVFGMATLIEKYPEILWAFFFGLIIGSAIFIYRLIENWGLKETIFILLGLFLGYWITSMSPVAGSTNFFYVFICGFIAISALILPGLSGSFLLLILGMYTTIIPLVKELLTNFTFEPLKILSIFALGAIFGLVLFSRVLAFTFKYYEDLTLSLLCGLMVGSLKKIWPWRNPTQWISEDGTIVNDIPSGSEHFRVINEVNVLPTSYDGTAYFWLCIIACILGLVVVLYLGNLTSKKDIDTEV